jgi:two-component system heavy metal sensor histidine kinase CusS
LKRNARFCFHPRSITAILCITFAVSVIIMLMLIDGSMYWMHVNRVGSRDARLLIGQANALRSAIDQRPGDSQLLKDEVLKDRHKQHSPGLYFRVLDTHGRTIIETPGMSQAIGPDVFPSPKTHRAMEIMGAKPGDSQMRYWLTSTWLGDGANDKRILQIALDRTHHDTSIRRHHRNLMLALLAGVVLSSVMGYAVAYVGLRPVREMAQMVSEVSAARLEQRVNLREWPCELAPLAVSFDAMLDRLHGSFDRLSQFSADIAHELRTPLNNLRNEAEVTLSCSRSAQSYRETIESSLEEYDRLSSMIDSLLFLARADVPAEITKISALDGRAAIEEVLEFFEALIEEHGIEARCEGGALVEADPILFRRAISNLISNSLQHTPNGGEIVVSMAEIDSEHVTVSVSDTGCGIGAEHLPRVMDRFYRASHSHSDKTAGFGLGLAITKSIMDMHQGDISIDSKIGTGTTVTLLFPK